MKDYELYLEVNRFSKGISYASSKEESTSELGPERFLRPEISNPATETATLTTKIAHMGPKWKHDPKNKSQLKVRIEENIEKTSFLTTWVDPNTDSEPDPSPQNSP